MRWWSSLCHLPSFKISANRTVTHTFHQLILELTSWIAVKSLQGSTTIPTKPNTRGTGQLQQLSEVVNHSYQTKSCPKLLQSFIGFCHPNQWIDSVPRTVTFRPQTFPKPIHLKTVLRISTLVLDTQVHVIPKWHPYNRFSMTTTTKAVASKSPDFREVSSSLATCTRGEKTRKTWTGYLDWSLEHFPFSLIKLCHRQAHAPVGENPHMTVCASGRNPSNYDKPITVSYNRCRHTAAVGHGGRRSLNANIRHWTLL